MFVFDPNPEFIWPVKALIPQNGSHVAVEYRARFRLIAEAERERLSAAGGDTELLRAAVLEILDVTGPDKKPFGRTAEEIGQLLALLPHQQALAQAYIAAVFGVAPGAAATGN